MRAPAKTPTLKKPHVEQVSTDAPDDDELSPPGWTISLEIQLPSDAPDIGQRIHRQVSQLLKSRGPVTRLNGSIFGAVFGVRSANIIDAKAEAEPLVKAMLDLLRVDFSSVVQEKWVANAKLDRELHELPHCVGVGEAAEILGVSKQRVGQLAQRADFPTPAFRLRATPVWREADVIDFAARRK